MGTKIAAIVGRIPTIELARKIGVDKNTVSDWKTSRKLPLAKNYEKIAAACGVTVEAVAEAVAADHADRSRAQREAKKAAEPT